MSIKKIKQGAIVATVGIAGLLSAQTASAGWIDWTSTSTGTLDVGGTTVGVTLSGNPASLIKGDTYYNNTSTGGTSLSGTYAGLAPSDVIQVASASSFTLTFDQTVSGLNMALVSVGQPSFGVTYDFADSFSVVSYGTNYWGYGGYSISGDDFTGSEFNGVLHFAGSFDSISFSTNPYEYWHGFNFGTESSISTVSEPATLALLGLGLAGLAASRRRKV